MHTYGSAPTFTVPLREVVALEHPMIIKDTDNGLKTLGSSVPLQQLLSTDGYEGCFPLYLRSIDPTCAPLLSNNTPSSNVLLKLTLPKWTGRKRKRGSDEPYTLDLTVAAEMIDETRAENGHSTTLKSHSRLDDPKHLLRSLRDNVGKYQIEPVGSISQTHRYRGMTDFHYSTTHGEFMTRFREAVLPGKIESLRKFKLNPSRGVKENGELIPPPTLSDKNIPFNWGYHQNSLIKMSTNQTTGEITLTNHSRAAKINTYYVPYDMPTVPSAPPPLPPPEPVLQSLLTELHKALAERPIWTRRAIMNRIPRDNPGIYLLKPAIQYVAYQFRGGPWRDAIVRYGVDPRSSPEYRIYQTIFFKIVDEGPAGGGSGAISLVDGSKINKPWHEQRSEYTRKANPEFWDPNSHIFDGKRISLDGKIWQVCDVTDPLLVRLLSTSTLRQECDLHSDGWFCNGTWAKVRAVMRTKITAIRVGRELTDEVFKKTLLMPDDVKDKTKITAHTPNLEKVLGIRDDGSSNDVVGDELDVDVEVEDLLDGAKGALMPGALGPRAWRRRKSRGLKRRRRKGLSGTGAPRMGFGRAGSGIDGRNLGAASRKGKETNKDGGSATMDDTGKDNRRIRFESGTMKGSRIQKEATIETSTRTSDDHEKEGSRARFAIDGIEDADADEDEGEADGEADGEDEDEDEEEDENEDEQEDDDDDDDDDEELDGEGW